MNGWKIVKIRLAQALLFFVSKLLYDIASGTEDSLDAGINLESDVLSSLLDRKISELKKGE